MPNQQLVDYINQCLAAGQTKEQIKQSLLQVGWQEGDINEALGGVSGSIVIPTTPSLPQDQSASSQVKYAGFWIRYIASSIDGLILTLAVNALPLILGFIFGNIFIILILRVIGLLFVPIYFIIMTYKQQATIGKKLANLMVISDKAENLSLGQVILRETIGRIVSSIFFIGYIMVGFTQRKQGLHDKIAKTTVIYKDPNKKVSVWVIILGVLVPVIMIGIIFLSIPLALFGALRNSDKTINVSINSLSEKKSTEEKIKNDIFNKIINEQEKKEQVECKYNKDCINKIGDICFQNSCQTKEEIYEKYPIKSKEECKSVISENTKSGFYSYYFSSAVGGEVCSECFMDLQCKEGFKCGLGECVVK